MVAVDVLLILLQLTACPLPSVSRIITLVLSRGTADRAEYHVMSHPQTFPRGLAPDYRGVAMGTTLGRREKNLFRPQVSLIPSRPHHRATAVFGHAGGRLVVPNTGERFVCAVSHIPVIQPMIFPRAQTKHHTESTSFEVQRRSRASGGAF